MTDAVETSFKLNHYHFKVFVVNLDDPEHRIQGDFNFSLGENFDEVTDHKASILPMLMIKNNKIIVKRKRCGSPENKCW